MSHDRTTTTTTSNIPSTTTIVDDIEILEETLHRSSLAATKKRDVFSDPSDYFLQPSWKRNTASGDVMVESLLECLGRFDRTDFSRSKEQREMHLLWTMACLCQIYGHEYMAKIPSLLRRFNVSSFSPYVAIFATRRFGKTFAMAMFVAAFLWTQRRSVISVFSISQRTSIAMKNKIITMLRKMLGSGYEIEFKVSNAEQLTIINGLGEESTVYSYPCSDRLRGMGSDGDEHNNIVLLEEAAFVKKTILMQIVVPLMMRHNAVFLTISTLGGMFDSWKAMTDAKDDRDRPVFLVKTYSTVCDDCIEMGIPDKCLHKRDLLPHWQSSEDAGRVKALMQSSKDDWLREAMGVAGSGGFIPAFDKRGLAFLSLSEKHLSATDGSCPMESSSMRIRQHSAAIYRRNNENRSVWRGASVVSMLSASPVSMQTPQLTSSSSPPITGSAHTEYEPKSPIVDGLGADQYSYCFIAVDPAAGGDQSNYAIISMVWETDGIVVVVGLEDFPTPKTLPASRRVLDHIDALRKRFPPLHRTIFVIAPECNMGNDANEMAYMVMHHRDESPLHRDRIIVLDEGGSQYGVRTEDRRNPVTSKESMRKSAAAVINPKKLRFVHNFVCVCNPMESRQAVIAGRFVKQLQVYGAEVLPPMRPGDRPRRRWHGKHGGQHDDLAMAFQLCLVANQLFFAQPRKYGI